MKKLGIYSAIAAALALSVGVAQAEEMEKCKVVDKDGKGLIKATKGQCGTSKHSCDGQNVAGDPESWIFVPKGQCEKINAGDFSGVSDEVKDRIEGAPVVESVTVESVTVESDS